MITHIEQQREHMLTMDHPFINDAKTQISEKNRTAKLLKVQTKVSDETILQSHTFGTHRQE